MISHNTLYTGFLLVITIRALKSDNNSQNPKKYLC